MYCNQCGRDIPDSSRFCPECGTRTDKDSSYNRTVPPITPVPPMRPRDPEELVLAAISAIIFGLAMIGGGIYSLCVFTSYTKWAYLGAIFPILAGSSCLLKGVMMLKRQISNRNRNN